MVRRKCIISIAEGQQGSEGNKEAANDEDYNQEGLVRASKSISKVS